MSESKDVLFETTGDVGILTFNRPERLNSMSGQLITEAITLVEKLSTDRSVRALVITGAGRGFCSGADLGNEAPLEDRAGSLGSSMEGGINRLILAIANAPFPVITAVNGPAAGAGVGIALAGDFLIASESMRLLLTFSRIGMGLDAGTSWFLAHMLGTKRAAAISMLVEPITAEKAMEWGIAYAVASDEKLMSAALELATRLSKGATLAYAEQKKQLRRALETTLEDALSHEASVQDKLIMSDDLKEGIAAFREGRSANYTGS